VSQEKGILREGEIRLRIAQAKFSDVNNKRREGNTSRSQSQIIDYIVASAQSQHSDRPNHQYQHKHQIRQPTIVPNPAGYKKVSKELVEERELRVVQYLLHRYPELKIDFKAFFQSAPGTRASLLTALPTLPHILQQRAHRLVSHKPTMIATIVQRLGKVILARAPRSMHKAHSIPSNTISNHARNPPKTTGTLRPTSSATSLNWTKGITTSTHRPRGQMESTLKSLQGRPGTAEAHSYVGQHSIPRKTLLAKCNDMWSLLQLACRKATREEELRRGECQESRPNSKRDKAIPPAVLKQMMRKLSQSQSPLSTTRKKSTGN
jgi:hypothetical protein